LFGCSTGGLVSYLSPAYGGSDVTIDVQHFLKKRNRMSGKTVQRDRQISSKLVHIEQVIDLAKSFKILTLASDRTEAKLVSVISFL
jgi:hypothetical protein